jgi:hypothetical protein
MAKRRRERSDLRFGGAGVAGSLEDAAVGMRFSGERRYCMRFTQRSR